MPESPPGPPFSLTSLAAPGLTALVGAGGKTSLMAAMAQAWANQHLPVVCSTTTHLFPPGNDQPCLLVPADITVENFVEAVTARLLPGQVLLTALPPDESAQSPKLHGKLRGLPPTHLDALTRALPHLAVLVEADGAARRPLKAPAHHEPVIPVTTRRIMGVMGLDVLDAPLDASHVHRPERLLALLDLPPDAATRVTPDMLARLAVHPEGLFKSAPSAAERWLVLNKADDATQYEKARSVAHRATERGFTGTILAGSARQNVWQNVWQLL